MAALSQGQRTSAHSREHKKGIRKGARLTLFRSGAEVRSWYAIRATILILFHRNIIEPGPFDSGCVRMAVAVDRSPPTLQITGASVAYQATVIPVMIASPGDVFEEREVVREVINTWNYIHSFKAKVVLMVAGWETHDQCRKRHGGISRAATLGVGCRAHRRDLQLWLVYFANLSPPPRRAGSIAPWSYIVGARQWGVNGSPGMPRSPRDRLPRVSRWPYHCTMNIETLVALPEDLKAALDRRASSPPERSELLAAALRSHFA